MLYRPATLALATLTLALAACAESPTPATRPGAEASTPPAKPRHQHYTDGEAARQASPAGALAPLLEGLGTHTFPATTDVPRAQLFIDQGVKLAYGFNHAEAGRAFREAARLDPECAMAYWGQALVLGPNINAPMAPESEAEAYELVQRAMELRAGASEREQAYIEALAQRYSGDPADRVARDRDYAEAMGEVMRRFPDDLAAAALYAEARMDLRPWDYWTPDGRPYEGTVEIVEVLESVIARDPDHPGALHFYIHVMEPTDTPERAEAAADRLATLMPAAGHIVHMPAHIYQRVGRYADSAAANERAIAADESYIAQCRAQGLYPMGYYPHNIHFLWFATTAQGRGEVAIAAARKVASKVSDEALAELPFLGGFRVVPYYALTRFGKWEQMLAEPAPPAEDLYLTGTWHYARGLAFVATGELCRAADELEQLTRIVDDERLDYALFSPNTAAQILSIAPEVLAGELAAAGGDHEAAIAHLASAVRLDDALAYTEPAEWHYPPRLALGAVLLAAGRAREAEAVYWMNLQQHPDNGWGLFGLHQALTAQGKDDDAALIEERFQTAWALADVELSASRIMAGPETAASPAAR